MTICTDYSPFADCQQALWGSCSPRHAAFAVDDDLKIVADLLVTAARSADSPGRKARRPPGSLPLDGIALQSVSHGLEGFLSAFARSEWLIGFDRKAQHPHKRDRWRSQKVARTAASCKSATHSSTKRIPYGRIVSISYTCPPSDLGHLPKT